MNIGAEIPYRRSRLGRSDGMARTGSLVFDRERHEKLEKATTEAGREESADQAKPHKARRRH